MLHNQDRSGWFGASDTGHVVGSWETATFRRWWMEKLGINFMPKFQNKYTLAGTYYEHAILGTVPSCEKDAQVIIPELGLRVNYDGIAGTSIKEVKTYKEANGFRVTKAYWRQAQAEMFAAGSRDLEILAYPLTEEHYKNYFIPVDRDKVRHFPVAYDEGFVCCEWLPRLAYLKRCLDMGAWPAKEEFERWENTKAKGQGQLTFRRRLSGKSGSATAAGALPAGT